MLEGVTIRKSGKKYKQTNTLKYKCKKNKKHKETQEQIDKKHRETQQQRDKKNTNEHKSKKQKHKKTQEQKNKPEISR